MTLDEYQQQAGRTSAPASTQRLVITALGLAGESGEVVELIKKHLGHGHAFDVEALCKELGDVLWYVADLAALAGLSLSTVAQTNLTKLWARYPNGFQVHSDPPPSGAHAVAPSAPSATASATGAGPASSDGAA